MDLDGPRRGARDNGLRCSGYVAVADFDPRIADALLEALRDNGIAAYAAPTPGSVGGAMETRLPDRPIDRLWVDAGNVDRARDVIEREGIDADAAPGPAALAASPAVDPGTSPGGTGSDPDFDAAWQQVLASLQSSAGPPFP